MTSAVDQPLSASLVRKNSAKTLEEALAHMRWEVVPGDFALVGFDDPATDEDLALVREEPAQVVCEGGQTTMLLRAELCPQVRGRHPRARFHAPLSWIRFRMPMEWNLVGFLAHVAAALARAGVPIGAVCGYSRDHLFVHRDHLPTTTAVLRSLFPGN